MNAAAVSDELLALLCCPESRQPLVRAEREVVEKLEKLRAAGTLRNGAGRTVEEPITDGLVRKDCEVFYPIQNGIPLLVTDEAVALTKL